MSVVVCICGWRCNVNADIKLNCPRCRAALEHVEPWPHWTRIITGRWRRPEDTGLGDSFSHMVDELGQDYVAWMMPRLGVDCGCQAGAAVNVEAFNREYPY